MRSLLLLLSVSLLAVALATPVDEVQLAPLSSPQEFLEAEAFTTPAPKAAAQPKKPANPLPTTPSDSKKQKDKDGKTKDKPSAKHASSIKAKKDAAKQAKHQPATSSKHVSLVSKATWAKVKAIKHGQDLSALLKEIGGAFLDKIKAFFGKLVSTLKKLVNPPRFRKGSSSASVVCHWVAHVDQDFNAAGVDFPTNGNDGLTTYGTISPGGAYVGTYVSREDSDGYDCFSGATAKSLPITGTASSDANLICVDQNNHNVAPPGNCKPTVQFFGAYQGTAYSTSDSGWVCPIGSRHIQVVAAQEAQIQISAAVPASKGLVVSTGNSQTETYSFQFTAGAKGGTDKDGASAGAEIGVSFGYSVVENSDFGEKELPIALQHYGTYPVPFNGLIQTIASAQINGAGRVIGSAISKSKGWYICLALTSTDCGLDNVGLNFGVALPDILDKYSKRCSEIRANNNVKFF